MYIGNDNLCGPPLNVKCDSDNNQIVEEGSTRCGDCEEDYEYEMLWWYIGIVFGYIVGFWAVCGTLLYNDYWRDAYFHFLEKLGEAIAMKCRVKNNDNIEEHD